MDFYNLSDDTIGSFKDIYNKKAFTVNLNFKYVGSPKQKTLIKISKIPDQYAYLLDSELLISINESLMSVFDEASINILLEQELDKVFVDIQSGKVKLIKPDLSTFSSIINKHGIDAVIKANSVEGLYVSQKEDSDSEFAF